MARLKRYDLYEGDGEIIRELDLTHGGEEGGNRTAEDRSPVPGRPARPRPDRRRYFTAGEDDGLGAEMPLYDDLSRFDQEPERPPRYRRRDPHRWAWALAAVPAALVLTALVLLMLPQLTGLRYRYLPNLAFANGNLISLDRERAENLALCRAEIFTDTIYPGVYIDDLQVGGMTREEAAAAVEALHRSVDRTFDIGISVGNEVWHVTTERVPVSRNTAEIVEKAWALGRSGSGSLKASGVSPFQDRVDRASAMRSAPVSLKTRVDWDHEALRAMTEGIANYVNRDPVNSTVESFDFNTKTFSFTEDRPGARLDPEEMYSRTAELLDAGETKGTLRFEPERVLAEVTKTELMNRFGLISAYTTDTTKNENRNTNISLSAQAINGLTVLPGETFSFNQATGERTAAKGYREAAAIAGGQSRDEIGGGVCQTSSTLFNAVARANLEIVERNPHAWPSNYVEKGFDATVNWPGLDFKFKNNTEWPVFILAEYRNRKVTVNLYGMRLEADTEIDLESITVQTLPRPTETNYVVNTSLAPGQSKKTVTGRTGYVVETWKVFFQGNRETKRELLFKTTYKPYQETVEYNPN